MTRRPRGRVELVAVLAGVIVVGVGCATPLPTSSPGLASWRPQPVSGSTAPAPSDSWRTVTVHAPDAAAIRSAATSSDLVAGDLTVWAVGPDGSWTPADSIDSVMRWGIAAWSRGFVDWGEAGAVRTSIDGLTWQDAAAGPGEANLSAVVPLEDGLLLLGDATPATTGAWLSADGSTWAAVPGAPLGLRAAVDLPGRGIVAVGAAGPRAEVWSSADGTTWRPNGRPEPAAGTVSLSGVAGGPAGLVAIGDIDGRAAAWRSVDLVSWFESGTAWGQDALLEAVGSIDGTYVIAGLRSARPTIWLSADGLAWSAVDLPVPEGVDGEAAYARAAHGDVVVFGYATEDAGNGGWLRTADLVWTVARSR